MAEPHLEERALVERARTEPEAFGLLYERYVKRIYTYVYYRTGSRDDAEDLTAQVFQRAVQRLNTYTDRGLPFVAWLYRIAHNTVANWYRDEGRRRALPLEAVPARVHGRAEGPEQLAERSSEQARVLAVLRRLTPERQQLLILKFTDQLSNAEIGQVLHRSESAIKSLYHRTLEELRAELTEALPELSLQPDAIGGPS
ncbi:MAG TPA: sigma-70 family RNA polymerase sigma factor [Anaerolineales bacterium]|nr:sigma-70 family RNA polymerase sigma factor [Anaerolineales bacterium]HRF49265.1 sigma-70 family RNA polymerase sigma factor [Anaerolineales bacterium]